MHGWYGSTSLMASRVPTSVCLSRQTSTSGRPSDNSTAADSAAIGRDAVTCRRDVFRDWLRVERLRQLLSSLFYR